MSDDYIPVSDAANALEMSPGRFAALLRKEREKLPVEINYELVKQLEDYYTRQGGSFKINIDRLNTIYDEDCIMLAFFPILTIHKLDWKAFLSDRKEEQEFIDAAQARITELETELAVCREQLEKARREISGKKYGDFFEAYPVCKMICDLHLAGKSRAEIRAALTAKEYTNAQTGFLTQEDTMRRSDDAIKKSVLRSKKDLEGSGRI